jgi:hypothetical protein
MFLLGARVDHDSATAFFVILEKHLKNVKNFYIVRNAYQAPASACQDEIMAFYHDGVYTIRKRVFSQDRRPKKDVSARPAVVLAAGQKDLPLIDALRGKDIPVEAIYVNDDSGKNGPGLTPDRAGIGKNHPASEQMIYTALARVLAQKRLDITAAEAPAASNQLLHEVGRLADEVRRGPSGLPTDARLTPLLTAAAAAIWFKENVRYASVYRTSATSIRKYK